VNPDLLAEWSGAAEGFLADVGMGDEPTDPWELAACHDLRVVHGGSRACTCRINDTIYIDTTLPRFRQAFDLAHELGHVAAELAGLYAHDEAAASGIGGRLLCPDRPLREHLRQHAWDLARTQPLYFASWEVLARRVAEVRSAIVTVVDRPPRQRERVTTRLWSPWLNTDWTAKPTAFERAVIASAFDTREHVYERNRITAYYVANEDGWERAILVCAAEDLEEATGLVSNVG
jgi:hypothetical protein